VEETRHKTLILILARELATNLATPVFVVDPEGTLVFYNEAAEGILGEPFGVVGELTRDQWLAMFPPEAPDGTPLPMEQAPLIRALREHIPVHDHIRVRARDGVSRDIAVTAFPLLVGGEEFAGAVAIFWERGAEEDAAGPTGPPRGGPGGDGVD
jgi:PAS domain-containing protein